MTRFTGRTARLLAGLVLLMVGVVSTATIARASCSAPCAYDAYIITNMQNGLVAYYPLYETSGTVMHDTSGNALDGTYNGGYSLGDVNGVTFTRPSGEATTPDLDLTPANNNTWQVTANWYEQDLDTVSTATMLLNQGANYNLLAGSVGFQNRLGSSPQYYAPVQSYDGGGVHVNADSFALQSPTTISQWHMFTVIWRRDQAYGFSGNDCYSAQLFIDAHAQTPITNQCWNMTHISFVKKYFTLAAYGSNQAPSHVVLRGLGFWTRGLSTTEMSDLLTLTFD